MKKMTKKLSQMQKCCISKDVHSMSLQNHKTKLLEKMFFLSSWKKITNLSCRIILSLLILTKYLDAKTNSLLSKLTKAFLPARTSQTKMILTTKTQNQLKIQTMNITKIEIMALPNSIQMRYNLKKIKVKKA